MKAKAKTTMYYYDFLIFVKGKMYHGVKNKNNWWEFISEDTTGWHTTFYLQDHDRYGKFYMYDYFLSPFKYGK